MTLHPRLSAALEAALRSFAFTACGVLAGFFALAAATKVTAGGITDVATASPALFWAFTKVTWFPFLVVNVIPPALRGIAAAKKGPS